MSTQCPYASLIIIKSNEKEGSVYSVDQKSKHSVLCLHGCHSLGMSSLSIQLHLLDLFCLAFFSVVYFGDLLAGDLKGVKVLYWTAQHTWSACPGEYTNLCTSGYTISSDCERPYNSKSPQTSEGEIRHTQSQLHLLECSQLHQSDESDDDGPRAQVNTLTCTASRTFLRSVEDALQAL